MNNNNNNKKNNDLIVVNKFIELRREQLYSRASRFDRGHIMDDFDLWIAARAILLCTGKMSEAEMNEVTDAASHAACSSLPTLLSKVEELGHRKFYKALNYVRPLNYYQAAHIENWYTNESKHAYRYKRRREYYKRRREYYGTYYPPHPQDGDELWESIKAKYPSLKGIEIVDTKYPKLKRITIGESLPNLPSSTTTHKRRKCMSTITIPRPAKGCFYTDEEQWNIIKKYPKGSPERSEAIRLMIQEHYVKSRATLYRHIKKSEDDKTDEITQQLMKMTYHITYNILRLGLGYKGDYIRPSKRGVVHWKGSIFLTVIPVSFAESEDMDSFKDSLSAHHPIYIDICKVIGNSDIVEPCSPTNAHCIQGGHFGTYNSHFEQLCEEKELLPLQWIKSCPPLKERGETLLRLGKVKLWQTDLDSQGRLWAFTDGKRRRIKKLYFPPSTFPPPTSDNTTEHKVVLGHLRNYVKRSAESGQSPVVCYGGNTHETRFRCKHWYKREKQPESEKVVNWHPYNMHSCTFTFVIRWDKYGYYIPLLEDPDHDHNFGCAWHCCEEH